MLIATYITQQLKKARYEYDSEAKVWCAWVTALPGVYAQAETVEEVRMQLAEVIEDYLIVSLQKGEGSNWLDKIKKMHASFAPSF